MCTIGISFPTETLFPFTAPRAGTEPALPSFPARCSAGAEGMVRISLCVDDALLDRGLARLLGRPESTAGEVTATAEAART